MYERETEKNVKGRYGFMKLGGGLATPMELRAYRAVLKAFIEVFTEFGLASKKNSDNPVIWIDWPVPNIIIRAFGLESTCPYAFMTFAQSNGSKFAFDYFQIMSNEGISSDVCGMNRIAMGAFFSGEVIKPTMIFSASYPCDSQTSANQLFEYYTDVPVCCFDAPYGRDEDSLDYYVKNIIHMISFIEEKLGKKIDWDRLKLLAEEMNKYNQLLNEVSIMNRKHPAPGLTLLLGTIWYIKILACGSKNITEACQIVYNIAKSRISPLRMLLRKRKEKIRIVTWDNNIVFTDIGPWLEKEYGAIVVADYIGHAVYPIIDTSTRESILRGIAADKLSMGMIRQTHGTIELSTEELAQMIHEYEPDCVIVNSHVGCKHNKALDKSIKDVCKKYGIPSLFLEIDIYDKRVVSEEEIKRRITEFFTSNGLA
jgi:benzoyl-CoA reductase/2-hydroxyglutaryl-CoA dehydratase subunit BcrC/BadD/HgdB